MNNTRIAGTIAGVIITGFLLWYFSNIVTYFLVAIVLSMIGSPIVKFLSSLHIGRFHLPRTMSCILALLIIIATFGLFIIVFIPLVSKQAALISQIDTESLSANLRELLARLEVILYNTGFLKRDQTLIAFLNESVSNFANTKRIFNFLNDMLSFTGSFFVGVFSIFFITFFLLKEEGLISGLVLLMVPERYSKETITVFSESKRLLSRYFIGIFIEVASMITLISAGTSILGIKNALLIGFIGGIMNVIPYLGPLIGASIGVVLGITSVLGEGVYDQLIPVIIIIVSTFLVANLIDNILLQPFIYSSSVKAHPLEIFIVLLMGGSMAGVIGMVLAIPAYTVIRVIASQFLNRFRIVQKLTERIGGT